MNTAVRAGAVMRLGCKVFLLMVLSGCSDNDQFTVLPLPEGALSYERTPLFNGGSRLTSFFMKVKFPEAPAKEHYAKVIGDMWTKCSSDSDWNRFYDDETGSRETVHEQRHIWVNASQSRKIVLTTRYYSPGEEDQSPSNDNQYIFLVETVGVDIGAEMRRGELECQNAEL